jgi:glutamyl-tRNA synthetase
MTQGVRVRFAPSPTGYLHVGGARTALFNWLFARRHKGTLVLRIEDTDVERSSLEMTQGILDAMTWLGLNWDEGPFYQSQRIELYKNSAFQLLEKSLAYYCECEAGNHNAACRERNLQASTNGAVRFRVPAGPIRFRDAVYGDIAIESDTVEDFVLLRTDGQPTYHLSVVVDDMDMNITHIIRGADHISNTPKQILLYNAFGVRMPVFAHVPLILGPDKTRLSKRHGATSVMSYKEDGIVPEAFRNFLALLGWSPGSDQEMFDKDELIEAFSLEGVSRTNAEFNSEKLAWFNAQYIAKLPHNALMNYLKPDLMKAGLWRDAFESTESVWIEKLLEVLRPRSRNLNDIVRQARVYIGDEVDVDAQAADKFLNDAATIENLQKLADRLEGLKDYSLVTTEATMRGLASELGIKPGALMGAARVALTGQSASPGMFDVMILVGQQRAVDRLRNVSAGVK